MTNSEAERMLALLKTWARDKESNWPFWPGPKFWMVTRAIAHLYPPACKRYGFDSFLYLHRYSKSIFPGPREIITILASIQGRNGAHNLGAKQFLVKCVRHFELEAVRCNIDAIAVASSNLIYNPDKTMEWRIRKYQKNEGSQRHSLLTIEWLEFPCPGPEEGSPHHNTQYLIQGESQDDQPGSAPLFTRYSVPVPVNEDGVQYKLFEPTVTVAEVETTKTASAVMKTPAQLLDDGWTIRLEPLCSRDAKLWADCVDRMISRALAKPSAEKVASKARKSKLSKLRKKA